MRNIARNGFAEKLHYVIYMDKWLKEYWQKTCKTYQYFFGIDPWEGFGENNLAVTSIHKRDEYDSEVLV